MRRSRRSTDDIGRRLQFHTPISAVMELVNELSDDPVAPDARFAAETAVSLIQPYAPHIAEELWERLGHERLWEHPWPRGRSSGSWSETRSSSSFRSTARCATASRSTQRCPRPSWSSARSQSEKVRAHLNGKQVRKTIVVPGRLVNLVVG